jgi:hypothetical protein
MKLVLIESPYAGDVSRNRNYALACMRDSLRRGEAPFAPHLLYTIVLDDLVHVERVLGMSAGFAWGAVAELVAVYEDLGVSSGMAEGIRWAESRGKTIEHRKLGGEWR